MSKSTRSTLAADLRQLGVRPGGVLMVHGGMRAFGEMVGGVNTLIHALLDVLGPEGTLAAYVDWESFYEEGDPEPPVFDKRIAHAARDHGVLHEAIRTWPGALRSDHPDAGVAAIGARAAWLTVDHPLQYGYGEGSPLEKVVQARGQVLMMGCSLDTITLLHYAEHLARLPGKRVVRYRRLMPGNVWVDFEEFDTSEPVCDVLPQDCFEQIARAYLDDASSAEQGSEGHIGQAPSALFDAASLTAFAIAWLERRTMPA